MERPVRPGHARRGAQVPPVPPPLFYVAGFALGMLLNRKVPWRIGGGRATALAGVAGHLGGLSLVAAGAAEVLRHHSTVIPHHEVSELVTSGVYRISRNPMYTGLAIAYTGVALRVRSWWPLVSLPAVLLLIRRLVIEPEERYLAARYGRRYESYRREVRRWL